METIISGRIPYSKIREVSEAAQKLEEQGQKIIHMEIGRPDFQTPPNIVDAAVAALRAGKTHYCQNAGIIELRRAVSKHYQKRDSAWYDPNTEILITNGVAEGIYLAISALLNPGDQILIPDPAWINYTVVPLMGLAEPVTYSLSEENDFLPNLEEIEQSITPRTKMMLLVNPSNPTGRVIPPDMLRRLADMVKKHDLILISDEIYEDIVYAPAVFTSMAAFEDIRSRLVILSGFSKSYSMTGWRLGYVLSSAGMANAMLRRHQYTITSVNTFAQWGAVEALEGTHEYVDAMVAEFERRKDFMYNRINRIKSLNCAKPEGAFYLFVSVKGLGMSGKDAAAALLQKYGVAVVPGESFGKSGEGYIRLSYACSMEDLVAAAEKIRQFAEDYAQTVL